MNSLLVKIVVSVALVGGGGGLLVYSSLKDAEYYKHVNEVLDEPERWEGRTLKVHGLVEPGSIQERIEGQSTKRVFVLEYEGQRIRVRNEGPKPDTFKDLSEVVAKGKIVKEGDEYLLEATELSAKCPSKYEENRRTKSYGQPQAGT